MELLFGVPGLISAFIFAFIERKGAISNTRAVYSLDNIMTIVFATVLFCVMLVYIILSMQLITLDDLATSIIASVITLRIMDGPAKFLVLKLIRKTV